MNRNRKGITLMLAITSLAPLLLVAEDVPLTKDNPVPENDANLGTVQIARRRLDFWYWEGREYSATDRTMRATAIRMDVGSAEAREYVRIARAITAPSITIPDDVAPTVDMYGEWSIVTFPYKNDMDKNLKTAWIWSDYYAEVIIESKTKTVLAITLNENLERKGYRSAENFAPLIAESKATPITWHSFRHYEEDAKVLDYNVSFKKVRLDPSDKKVAEYVRIAWTEIKRIKLLKVPDDVVPTAAIQGENIVVSFPWRPPKEMPKEQLLHMRDLPSVYAEVVIDIKKKTVLEVIGARGISIMQRDE